MRCVVPSCSDELGTRLREVVPNALPEILRVGAVVVSESRLRERAVSVAPTLRYHCGTPEVVLASRRDF